MFEVDSQGSGSPSMLESGERGGNSDGHGSRDDDEIEVLTSPKALGRAIRWYRHVRWLDAKIKTRDVLLGPLAEQQEQLLAFFYTCLDFRDFKTPASKTTERPMSKIYRVSSSALIDKFKRYLYYRIGANAVKNNLVEESVRADAGQGKPETVVEDSTQSGDSHFQALIESLEFDPTTISKDASMNVGAPTTAKQARERHFHTLVGKALHPLGVVSEDGGKQLTVRGIRRRYTDEQHTQLLILKETIVESILYTIIVLIPALVFLVFGRDAHIAYTESSGYDAVALYAIFDEGQLDLSGNVYMGTKLYLGWMVALFALSYFMLAFAKFDFYTGYAKPKIAAASGKRTQRNDEALRLVTLFLCHAWSVVAIIFAYCYALSIWAVLSSFVCVVIWLVASIFVNAQKYLAVVSSVLLTLVLVAHIINSFEKLWSNIKKTVHTDLDDGLKELIVQKIQTYTATLPPEAGSFAPLGDTPQQGAPSPRTTRAHHTGRLLEERVDTLERESAGVYDYFELLGTLRQSQDEEESLLKAEYFEFIDDLGLHIASPTKEHMFAFADVDGNGSVRMDELERTWTYFKDIMVYRIANRLGVTELRLVLTVVGVLTLAAVLVYFVALVVQNFGEEDGFTAIISTIFTGIGGILVVWQKGTLVRDALSSDEIDVKIVSELAGTLGKKTARTAKDIAKGFNDGASDAAPITGAVLSPVL